MDRPLAFYYTWERVSDAMIPNVMAEFSWHGVENLVFSDIWLKRFLQEPGFAAVVMHHAHQQKVNLISAHGLWGQPYDLCCPDRGRRDSLIEDHRRAMGYCADSGCRTYTVHVGAYESVVYQTPNETLRPLALESLERLLPTAEKLGLIIAVENAFERSNTPDEVLFYVNHFNSEHIQCCYDTGHANVMAPGPGKVWGDYMTNVTWGGKVETYEDAVGRMAPHIVTCHIHDNNGLTDSHAMPGTGTIDWKDLIPKLKKCPRLQSMQTEVEMVPGVSIAHVVEVFRKLMQE